jgi:hypothetical protein
MPESKYLYGDPTTSPIFEHRETKDSLSRCLSGLKVNDLHPVLFFEENL